MVLSRVHVKNMIYIPKTNIDVCHACHCNNPTGLGRSLGQGTRIQISQTPMPVMVATNYASYALL